LEHRQSVAKAQFPAVTLLGPRQCGKTTLASTFATLYFNLEAPEERTRLDATWPETMASDGPVVFDEAHYWPELFRRLRGEIDAKRKRNGRFILLGSVAPSLMRDVSESLAGGASWEGFVIEQLLTARAVRGEDCDAYFFRSHDGYEADLVLERGEDREVIEIKLTSGPSPADLARLSRVGDLLKASRKTLICRVRESALGPETTVANLPDYLKARSWA